MMVSRRWARCAVLGLFLLLPWQAHPAAAQSAGRCTGEPLSVGSLSRASEMAVRLYRSLETQRQRVAIIARVGGDISDRGLKYTHAGFAWRDHPRGDWTVMHVLNHCASGRSGFFEQRLLNFFLDDPHRYDVLVMVPSPALAAALSVALADGTARRLFVPRYNMVSHPRSTRFQNSNQWVLEVVAMAQARLDGQIIADRTSAQRFYTRLGYRGTRISVGFVEQFFAGMFSSSIHPSDQPAESWGAGEMEVVTVRSLNRYLQRTGDLQAAFALSPP